MQDWDQRSPKKMFALLHKTLLSGPAGDYCADVLDAIEDLQPDAIATDLFLFGALIASEKAAIPTAVLVPNIYPWPRQGVPPVGPGLAPASGLLTKVRDKVVGSMGARLWNMGLADINLVRSQHGLDELSSVFEQADRADRVLVLTSAAFDLDGDSPDNVRFVGPVLDDPSWADSSHLLDPDDHRPLVLVSMSSTFQDQLAAIRRVVEALDGMNVRAVVTLGPALDPSGFDAPANVTIVQSAPHAELLPKAAVVVTHCGHGTTIKALAAGVPLVCLPMGRDQNDTAARVVHHGAGLRLKPAAQPVAIRRAITTVLDNPHYRQAATRLANEIRSDIAADRAIDELERLPTLTTRSRPA